MNNSKTSLVIIGSLVIILIVGIIGFAITQDNSDSDNSDEVSISQSESSSSLFSTGLDSSRNNVDINSEDAQNTINEANQLGVYTELANFDLAQTGDEKNILFFKADWCSTCNALDGDIVRNQSEIPFNVNILEIDYDSETDLKIQYGVTLQHTLVQVDSQGNQLAKWTGSRNLEDLLAKIV